MWRTAGRVAAGCRAAGRYELSVDVLFLRLCVLAVAEAVASKRWSLGSCGSNCGALSTELSGATHRRDTHGHVLKARKLASLPVVAWRSTWACDASSHPGSERDEQKHVQMDSAEKHKDNNKKHTPAVWSASVYKRSKLVTLCVKSAC